MNVSIELFVSIGGIIATAATSYGIIKVQCEKLWEEVHDIKSWREHHMDMSTNCQLNTEKRLGEIRTSQSVRDEQYKEIIRRLDSIDKKIEIIHERRISSRKIESEMT